MKTALIIVALVPVIALGIPCPSDTPFNKGGLIEKADTTISITEYQQHIDAEYQTNVKQIDQLKERNIYLRGYYDAIETVKKSGVDSVTVLKLKPKR